MLLFIPDLIIAVLFGARLAKAYLAGTRGTNALTRTMRDVVSNAIYKNTAMLCLGISIPFFILGLIFKCAYVCFPTVAVAVGSFIIAFKQQQSKQRVKDARVVTKGSLKVAAATAEAAGTVAGIASGVPGGAVVGAKIGDAVGSLSDDFANSMTDVEAPEIRKITIEDPEAFIAACKKAGVDTEGKDLGQLAAHIADCAPQFLLEQHPDAGVEEIAKLALLGGK